jgi:6-phosphogluconolactonase
MIFSKEAGQRGDIHAGILPRAVIIVNCEKTGTEYMKASVNIYGSGEDLAASLADEIVRRIRAASTNETPYSVALSGGSGPVLLYSLLGDEYINSMPWDFVHFFWGDERCVPPDDPESNYGMAMKHMIGKIGMPLSNIHRIKGEEDPEKEARRYSDEIYRLLRNRDGMPVFDLQIMGMGEDGHTASIFAGNPGLFSSGKICEVTIHPATGQKRITLTGSVINNSEAVAVIVQGKAKSKVLAEIINKEPGSDRYPAAHIHPVYGSLDWYMDKDAAELLHR